MRRADISLYSFFHRFSLRLMLLTLLAVSPQLHAQSENDFKVSVVVADQGSSQRDSGYWLAFDRVLRRQVETRIRIEDDQREALMKDPSIYVQSFRYREYKPGVDGSRLSSRKVREGAPPSAVIEVTFPTNLAAIVQQQLIPVESEESIDVVAPIMALVAVEQNNNQFIIGGDRGKKFQARAMQLAAANNLQLQFPALAPADLELINAADILSADVDRINGFVSQYAGNDLLTGALFLLSPTTWQSDWNYTSNSQAPVSFSLTTATLDEALVEAMTQISPGGGYLSSTYANDAYSDGAAAYQSAGVEIRIENITSLAEYDRVLKALQNLDPGVMTATLDYDAMVFRATEQGGQRVRDSLIASQNFEVLSADQFGAGLSFRYQAR